MTPVLTSLFLPPSLPPSPAPPRRRRRWAHLRHDSLRVSGRDRQGPQDQVGGEGGAGRTLEEIVELKAISVLHTLLFSLDLVAEGGVVFYDLTVKIDGRHILTSRPFFISASFPFCLSSSDPNSSLPRVESLLTTWRSKHWASRGPWSWALSFQAFLCGSVEMRASFRE